MKRNTTLELLQLAVPNSLLTRTRLLALLILFAAFSLPLTLQAQGLFDWAGGPVVKNARIVALYWGTPDSAFKSRMDRFYSGIAASSYVGWLSDYSTVSLISNRPGEIIGSGQFGGSYVIQTTGSGNVETTDIGPTIDHLIHIGQIRGHDVNTIYMVHFSSKWKPYLGTNLIGFPIGALGQAHHASYFSTFTNRTIIFAALPDQSVYPSCSIGTSRLDAETNCASHELIEAVTDPGAAVITGGFLSVSIAQNLAWQLPTRDKSFNPWEIADQCEDLYPGLIKTSSNVQDTYVVAKGWQNKSSSCVVSSPIGSVDGVGPDNAGMLHVFGWALDPNREYSQIQVHLYFDGPYPSGKGFITYADRDRPDVNSVTGYLGWHGFEFLIPAQYRDGKKHSVHVYAIGVNNGNNSLLGMRSFPPPFKQRYTPVAGGYVTYDQNQKMIVSASPGGGPSENFNITVDVPKAGTYSVDAMWTAAVPTEVYVYDKPLIKSCTDPSMNMNDAAIDFLPEVRGGWGRETLPTKPQHVGNLLLPKGSTQITFTSRSCGNGLGNGRVPSTAWVELTDTEQ